MKNILFVINFCTNGGFTSSLRSILNSPVGNDIEPYIFEIYRDPYAKCEDLRKYSIGNNRFTTAYSIRLSDVSRKDFCYTLSVRCVKRICSLLKFDLKKYIFQRKARELEKIAHFDHVVAFSEGEATNLVSFFNNPNKIAWIHCDYTNWRSERIDETQLYNLFAKIVCVSNFTRLRFVSRYPSLSDKAVAIHNLLDKKRISLLLSNSDELDKRFTSDLFTIISVGRLDSIKRFSYIPYIAYRMLKAGLKFKWYIIGSGTDKIVIETEIKHYNIEENVILLGNKDNPYPYFGHSSLLVSTSSSEACPMIFNEAKILGIPIVSADFPTAKEFIDNGVNGIIAPIDEIWRKIVELAEDKELYTTIKKNSHLDSSYNESIIDQLETLLG